MAISVNKKNLTWEYIKESGFFTVSVLSKDVPMPFIGMFGFKSGRDTDKFKGINYKTSASGVPVITDYTTGYFEAGVIDSIDVGTHTIFIGRITGAEVLSDADPMTYAYYHQVKGGKSPKNAPTYIAPDNIKEELKTKKQGVGTMSKYKCTVCGYIYDPEKGDPDSGVAPGTSFEQIPDTWVCPVCGVKKDQFEKI